MSLFILQSCSKHHAAPVEDLSKAKHKAKRYKPKSNNSNRYKRDYVKVKKGDTLYSIGFAHDIDYKKIAVINKIKPPYRIYPGQKLKLKGNVTILKKVSTSMPKTVVNQTTTKPLNKTTINKPPVIANKKPPPKNNPAKSVVKTEVKTTPVKKAPRIVPPQTTPKSNAKWIWPVKGRILSSFSSSDTSRKGIKIAVNYGQSVKASNTGIVVYSGDGLRGYGELIIIKHSNNLLSAYAHNSKRFVKEGQSVKQGQEIAKSGKGNDGKPLLHFEIRKNGQPVNPANYLPK